MKKLTKMMALVIAMVMIVSTMSISAFAAVDRSISVGGLDTGDKVNFYKILNWADDTDEATAKGAVSGWYWAAPFSEVLTSKELKDAINDDNQLMLTDTLAGKIARVINEKNPTPVNGSTPVAEVNKVATLTFAGETTTDKDGLYMAVVTPKDQDTVYNPIFVHLDSSTDTDSFNVVPDSQSYYQNNGVAKKSKVTLTKESHNANDYTTPTADDGDTTKPGDELSFKVETTIPGYGNMFNNPAFKITDTMNGLTLDPSTITVKLKDGTEIAAANYTKTADANGYTIDFKSDYLKTILVASDIVIEYKATVKEGANTNVIKEKNTVELEFSHDPTTESDSNPGGDKQYKKDITNHYTFSIDANNLIGPSEDRIGESGSEIIKIGVDKNGDPITSETTWSKVTTTAGQQGPLAGAEFELLDKNKQSFNPKKVATSDASGRLNFTGLDAGEYWLQETKAPAGYVKQSDPVKITISAELEEREITEYYDQEGNWYSEEGTGRTAFTYKTKELKSYTVTYGEQASSYTFTHAPESKGDVDNWNISSSSEAPQSIANTKGVELPSTGGMGTTIFYIVGAILVLGAGILLVTRRRMRAE